MYPILAASSAYSRADVCKFTLCRGEKNLGGRNQARGRIGCDELCVTGAFRGVIDAVIRDEVSDGRGYA